MTGVGIDIGSKYVKAAVISGDKNGFGDCLIHRNVEYAVDTALKQAYKSASCGALSLKKFCVTGDEYYKKRHYTMKSKAQCIAEYFHGIDSGEILVIDAGNMFIDAMVISHKGKILESGRNDRCFAGCGRFIEIICQALRISFADIDFHYHRSDNPYSISSGCIVFAESEVVTQVNSGVPIEDIIAGIIHLVAGKISTMYERYFSASTKAVYITGGVSSIKSINLAFKDFTNVTPLEFSVPPQYVSAYGAALLSLKG